MMTTLVSTCLLIACTAFGADRVIYGEDNRVDVFASDNALYKKLANSTAAMIHVEDLEEADQEGIHSLLASPLLEEFGLCPSERFVNQPAAANCSGFLVGPNWLVTAGHCVRSQSDCDRYRWVFDYKMQEAGVISLDVPDDNIFACKRIISQELDPWGTSNDYALIELDRVAEGREPLEVRTEGEVEIGDPLVVIGHPSGLPTKIADGASVRSIDEPYYFVANLDTYGGNSGSAVFNSESGVVEGILVRGETDYNYQGGCRVSNVCDDNGCRGEDVTRITVIPEL